MTQHTTAVTRVARAAAKIKFSALSDRDLLARFVAEGDQGAFAAVVDRHAVMVFGVCRRALPRGHDPEDVCQAVFLLLAEKAAGTRWQASVANWLYSTARNVARNARVAADRRRGREARAAVPEAIPPADAVSGRELAALLDEELDRLPPHYRAPLVLCYLEGLTQDEAAIRLGVPEATLKSQLKRGRKKLADALTARGCDLGVVLLVVATASAVAATPPRLADSILTALAASSTGRAAALARGLTVNSMLTRAKVTLLALATAAVVGLGAVVAPPDVPPPAREPESPTAVTEPSVVSRIGSPRFRAAGPIDDARYSADGKRVVGHAGSTLYVWDAGTGALLRTIDTKLELLDDPTKHGKKELAFAMHPKESRVACGGARDDKTHLQIWDIETGKIIAEKTSSCDALKSLAWTPDGKQLLERANVGWEKPTGWKLIVRDDKLEVARSHDLPDSFGEWSTVMHPLPGSKQAILWQSGREPTVFDLESGEVVRTLPHKVSIPSDLAASPDGKILVATSTEDIRILTLPTGDTDKQLPVLRRSWEKPRPLFSRDGKTVFVWDHRPLAYDVASGKEKWRTTFRTLHTVRVQLCDVSPDGATVLVRHGHGLSRLDAKTGTERDPIDAPSVPTGLVWAPDGRTLFTRAVNHDRTWTAWDAGSGKRLYDLLPTGFAANENWKMLPDLFFIGGGKEIVAGLENSESTERSGSKELLVFDAGTGQCKRRLGAPLPDETFRWMHPISVADDGATVLMQAYAVSGAAEFRTQPEFKYPTVLWDTVRKGKIREWTAVGAGRTEPPRHYAPYSVFTVQSYPNIRSDDKPDPARLRCYSLADGKLAHELRTDFASTDPDRVQGNFLLTVGYDSKWVSRANSSRYTPQSPYAYDLWELTGRDKVRVFELDRLNPVVLGPEARFVLRLLDDNTFEVYEPFVLKKAVATISTAARPVRFEFSPDGNRVAVSLSDTSVVVWDTAPWQKQLAERLARTVPTDLAPGWDDLAKDATTGLRAARILSAAGDKAVSLLGEKITAKKALDAARMKGLIADLSSPQFDAREKAEKELRALGAQAEPYLRDEVRTSTSPESRQRAGNLLKAVEARSLTAAENREVRAVQALQWIGTDSSRALLAKWAKGDPHAPLTKAAGQVPGR
ncbi:ECF RNA polymerase sigma factor SigE [Gemmata sp. SH-PL17]|uniref:sigma-70 family RNA polymerase sigma factor n=1 Tax=Gemmata sp. SH-PL17 TaxID=1630693 RepID=UPI00078B92EB|nr:sigma-70 family RNA polymerase sigma factor [Gemmata sp. SH-PL17]AMV29611.1 ECF RNA polymerase sigma factor SigE [Gemmata sp. SH-PL17]